MARALLAALIAAALVAWAALPFLRAARDLRRRDRESLEMAEFWKLRAEAQRARRRGGRSDT